MREFIKSAFSDNGQPSSSRLLTAIHTICSCSAFLYVTFKNRAIPDAVTLGGLGLFATVHYAVNAARNVFQKPTGQ